VTLTEELKQEGIARDLVNRIQNLRKDMGLEVQDKIKIQFADDNDLVNAAVAGFGTYIEAATQAVSLSFESNLENASLLEMDDFNISIKVEKA
jgi:isoleucyl-tRNA synthetase